MRRRGYVLVLGVLAFAAVPLTVRSQTSVESELLGYINGGRSATLTPHAGLLAAARGHSADMAGQGDLNHNGAGSRILGAAPDPGENNGSPDDGFSGVWCENVAYVSGAPSSEVAQRMYEAWRESPSHNRCMNYAEMNVAGLGIYQDGKRWWATLELAVDRSLPGSVPDAQPADSTAADEQSTDSVPTDASAAPASPAAPVDETPLAEVVADFRPSPVRPVNQDASNVDRTHRIDPSDPTTRVAASAPQHVASRFIVAPAVPSRAQRGVEWPGLMGTFGALGIVGELMRRLSRRPGRSPA